MEAAAFEPPLVLAGMWPLIGPSEELPHHSPDQPAQARVRGLFFCAGILVGASTFLE